MFYKIFEPDGLETWKPFKDGEKKDLDFDARLYKRVKEVSGRALIYGYEHFGFSFSAGFRKAVTNDAYLALALSAYSNTMLTRNSLWPAAIELQGQPDSVQYFLAYGTPLRDDMEIMVELYKEEASKVFEGSAYAEAYIEQIDAVNKKLADLWNRAYKDRIPTEEDLYRVAEELRTLIQEPEPNTEAMGVGDVSSGEMDFDPSSIDDHNPGRPSHSVEYTDENGEKQTLAMYLADDDKFGRDEIKKMLKNGFPPEIENLSGDWGKLIIRDRLPLTHTFEPDLKPFVRDKLNDEGVYPKRLDRLPIDGRLFRTKGKMDIAGAVLIDDSGSMGLSDQHIQQLMHLMPGVIIAAYSGDHSRGELKVLARRNRCLNPASLSTQYGGNVVDGPALLWLMEQRGPRVWISDGGVTGCGDRGYANLYSDVYQICKYGNIIRIPSLHTAVKAGADIGRQVSKFMKRY